MKDQDPTSVGDFLGVSMDILSRTWQMQEIINAKEQTYFSILPKKVKVVRIIFPYCTYTYLIRIINYVVLYIFIITKRKATFLNELRENVPIRILFYLSFSRRKLLSVRLYV